MKKITAICLLGLILGGCADNPDRARNAAIGGVAGAVVGQAWGRNHEATLAGAAVGAIIGSQVRTGFDNNAAYQGGYQDNNYQQGGYQNNQGYYDNGGYGY